MFSDQYRLSALQADPLPTQPIRSAFEDGLITHLITTVDFEQHSRELRTIDRPRLLSLYGRYRAVPNSLTDDQKALIFASLCLARHTQITTPSNGEIGQGSKPSREDVTYYRLACEMLQTWGRSSIYSVCKWDIEQEPELPAHTARGALLPGSVFYRTRRPSRKCRSTPTDGRTNQGARPTSAIGCSVVCSGGYGAGHVLGLSIHGSVSHTSQQPTVGLS